MKSICWIITAFFLFTVPLLAETYEVLAPEEGYATALMDALASANDDDIIVLSSPGAHYLIASQQEINSNVTLISADFEYPAILLTDDSLAFFNITEGKQLELVALHFNGDSGDGDAVSSLIHLAYNSSLIVRHCTFEHVSSSILQASGDGISSLYMENCQLSASPLFEGENTRCQSLELNSCIFTNTKSPCVKVFGLNNSEVLINHCVFDSVAFADGDTILSLVGITSATVKNSSFSNNSYAAVFALETSAIVDYCNFYNSVDYGFQTGSNCTYYNPQYDDNYFLTNVSLSGKADDGKNIGPLEWDYTADGGEEIDLGDNPYGFENQGVWIVPKQDEFGLWESYFLKKKEDGLWYRKNDKGDHIPDFSYCGYKMGNETIPELPVVATIYPMVGDAYARIQEVIDSVANYVSPDANGLRGAILIKSGIYSVSSTLEINASGIVLRGEGDNESTGTVLLATSTSGSVSNPESLIRVGQHSGSLSTTSGVNIAVPYIPVGANYVIVDKGHSFVAGDQVAVYQSFNDQLVTDLGMDQIPDRPDGTPSTQWNASSYTFYYEREVVRTASAGAVGDSIFFYNPIVNALDKTYNATRKLYKASYASRINNSGLEDMLLKSVYASETDESHAWNAIYFDRAEHCWATNITSMYFAFALANMSKESKYITVDNCTCLSPKSEITGARRYSFNVDGQMCLVTNCYASEGRHDYVNGSRICGPNVFTNCVAENAYEDIGPHHRWATGTLYDKITTNNTINVQDRGYYGSGHGWAGANMVFWGCTGKSSICQNPQVYARNYNIGFTGQFIEASTFGNRPRGEWEGNNVVGLNIPSLYQEQRHDRGMYVSFGLTSNQIGYINDSTFRLSFNADLDPVSATNIVNYCSSGNAGITGHPLSVKLVDSSSVEMVFANAGLLQYGSRLDIDVSGVRSLAGDDISAIASAYIIIPDMRPSITMERQTVSNTASDYVTMSSDKAGDVYLTFVTIVPDSVAELENAVKENKASVEKGVLSNERIQVSTQGLNAGLYYAYAIDNAGRISVRSANYVLVEAAQSLEEKAALTPEIYYSKTTQRLIVDLKNTTYNRVEVYDLSGCLLKTRLFTSNRGVIDVSPPQSMLLVRCISGDKFFVKKIIAQ